ncbi:alpha-amylase family glycosyl hydrolase [Cesiribacter andamanensis]|uniref:Alpha-amylase n=1 Tax=Cesiribacter andamanensis AMV16 TaxID=1279009 RepID=M7NTF2_9BACT|nr:alpha-amylase family glycosyl hydrolase [Cesiribacter andamanensis]EMR01744.1 Alpha-amylase precursor [Cesiribacter andamanensis AMV16]
MGSSDLRLPVVQFDACNPQLILSVNMNQENSAAQGVHVAGNFQALAGYGSDWNPSATPLHDPDGDGTYEVRISLPTQGLFQYKYINGNSWQGAEQVPAACGVEDGNGGHNRTIEATSELTTAPTYCFSSCESCSGTGIPTTYDTYWWNDAVFYEIFVRSFYDSNGDGKGDFRGMIEKLDYLNDGDPETTTDLGISGIWLMPMMASPSYHGYDVTDYYATEPDYGTMADFEAFLEAAHARGIRVIIDFVMNHSSSQHPWFSQSAGSTDNPYRDWYIWSENNPGFGGPWGQEVWHPRNGAYYYGLFWGGMPDLNWSNPDLQEEMWDITRFWLEKGVDGYRLDAIKYLDEDGTQLEDTPETFALLQEFNQVYKSANPDAFTVGEIWSNTASVAPYVRNNRLDAAFEFDLSYAIINGVRTGNPTAIRNQLNVINRSYAPLQYATFLTNHDQNRILEEFGGNMQQMRQAAALYLSMPGIPFLYYGEEIGMLGTKPDEDIRRPMQWTPGEQAGFTSGTPWRALNSNYPQFNVQTMERDANSLLNHYKKLIHIRNQQATLRRGYLLQAETTAPALLSYARVYEEEMALVVSNLGSSALTSPGLALEASSLPAGTYPLTELYSGQAMGSLTVNEQGGFSQWTAEGSLPAGETWIVLLSHRPQQVVRPTGLSPELDPLGLQLYPNPSTGLVQLQLRNSPAANSELRVYDLAGKLLQRIPFSGHSLSFSTSAWASGTYILSIRSGSTQSTRRLVVH